MFSEKMGLGRNPRQRHAGTPMQAICYPLTFFRLCSQQVSKVDGKKVTGHHFCTFKAPITCCKALTGEVCLLPKIALSSGISVTGWKM